MEIHSLKRLHCVNDRFTELFLNHLKPLWPIVETNQLPRSVNQLTVFYLMRKLAFRIAKLVWWFNDVILTGTNIENF